MRLPTTTTLTLSLSILTATIAAAQTNPYAGTIWLEPDIIKETDPTAFVSLRRVGRGMREMTDRRNNNDWVTVDAFLFDADYSDGLKIEIQVHPDFQTVEAAETEAKFYAPVIGRIPRVLRKDVRAAWILPGGDAFGGGNNALQIHTGKTQDYLNEGNLEETLVHEAAHTSLEAEHAKSGGWVAAQASDPKYISDYAASDPEGEDISETFLTYIAQRYRSERISAANLEIFRSAVPARNAYFNSLRSNLHPLVGGNPPPGTGWYKLRTELQGDGKCLESNQVTAPTASLRASTREGVVFQGASFMDNCQNVTGQAWKFVTADVAGNYRLKSQFQGDDKCLEVEKPDPDAVLGGAAFMAACGDVDSQIWELVPLADGSDYYKLQNRAQGGMCLEGNRFDWGDKSQQHAAFLSDCSRGAADQRWAYVAIE